MALAGDLNACDASRILRIPGTANIKYNPPRACELTVNDDFTYSIDDFLEILPEANHHMSPKGDTGNKPGWLQDLMAGVDEILKRGYIDKQNLFVCGGSGGGVLTSWIVGHTNRFTAAVVMKPVTNWFSFVGTTDGSGWYRNFKKLPWEDPEEHLRRSSLMYVGNVTTPTLLLTGEKDLRTPMEQTEQYYQALRLRKIETAMVRIQDEYHGIGRTHPTNKIRQILYLREWFEKYKKTDGLTRR